MAIKQRQNLIIRTTGSTGAAKVITHSWDYIDSIVNKSINLFNLNNKDRILNLYPSHTIANWTLTSLPAYKVGCEIYNIPWNVYDFIKIVNEYKPTFIGIVPSHIKLLSKTKGWNDLTFSGCRINIGADKVTQEDIDLLLGKGAEIVYHTYGMSEIPPPLAYSINSEWLDCDTIEYPYYFNDNDELFINGINTHDCFKREQNKMSFCGRQMLSRKTWKNV